MINLKVFHLSIKKIFSLFPVFQFFNAATEIPHGRVFSSNKNQPVKSPFPNEMGLSIKVFSKGTVTGSLSYCNCCFILVCRNSCYTKSWEPGGFNRQLVSLWLGQRMVLSQVCAALTRSAPTRDCCLFEDAIWNAWLIWSPTCCRGWQIFESIVQCR